jgi:pyridoxal phosphate enzyme (YggS family)
VIDSAAVQENLSLLRSRIGDLGHEPESITIVAVTKGFGADAVAAAVAAGLTDLGENYAQEVATKHAVAPAARWHFIGRLQSNKVAQLSGLIDEWQSLDRPKLIRRVAEHDPGASVRIQVNISGEPNKGGCEPNEAGKLVEGALDAGLDVVGLMGVAAAEGEITAQFQLLRQLADANDLEGCSMGMSGDLAQALGAGTTMIRVGTGLFGPRPIRDRGT